MYEIMTSDEACEKKQEKLFVITRSRNITIDIKNIVYVESRRRKVAIFTRDENLEIYGTMMDMEKRLGKNFYRCHRGYIVNLACVAEYNTDSITLNNSEKIYMAKNKYNEFHKIYMEYLKAHGAAFM